MHGFKFLVLGAAAATCFAATGPQAEAQLSINIGVAPECPYGYYDVAPYSCAPSGYYGPEWFSEDVFIGAGPWFHGPGEFRGHKQNGAKIINVHPGDFVMIPTGMPHHFDAVPGKILNYVVYKHRV